MRKNTSASGCASLAANHCAMAGVAPAAFGVLRDDAAIAPVYRAAPGFRKPAAGPADPNPLDCHDIATSAHVIVQGLLVAPVALIILSVLLVVFLILALNSFGMN